MILLTEKHNILKTPQVREQQAQEHLPVVAMSQEELLGVAGACQGAGLRCDL